MTYKIYFAPQMEKIEIQAETGFAGVSDEIKGSSTEEGDKEPFIWG